MGLVNCRLSLLPGLSIFKKVRIVTACGAEAPLPPRVFRDIPDETVKALVDCLVIIIGFGDNGCVDVVQVLRGFVQVSRLRQCQ